VRLLSLAVICSLLASPAHAQKRQTESELNGLRGAVKSVAVEVADLEISSGKLIESARRLSVVTTYDASGGRASEKQYDEKGRLTRTNSYSDADGYRVESGESFDYGDGRVLVVPEPGGGDRNRDAALKDTAKYKYKYDGSGNVSEESVYGDDGSPNLRRVYKIVGNRKEILTYIADGSPGGFLNDREVYVYDKKGYELEEARFFPGEDKPDSKATYKYVEFDDKGNWRKRIVSWEILPGGRVGKSSEVEYRRITYY
jgi:hypothetical protein